MSYSITDSIVKNIEDAPNRPYLIGYLAGVLESMGEREISKAINKAHYKFQEDGENYE